MGPQPPPREYAARTSLPCNQLAASAGRRFVRAALAEWTALGAPGAHGISDGLVDDAVLLTSELVTNAVVHARTNVELRCRWDCADAPARLRVEVADHHPGRMARDYQGTKTGWGLRLVDFLAESWGVGYHHAGKAVWFRLQAEPEPPGTPRTGEDDVPLRRELRIAEILAPAPLRDRGSGLDRFSRGSLAFLAEAGDLLAGQLDEDAIAALTAGLLVPGLADWCAVWLTEESEGSRLARVRHLDERRAEALRSVLEKEPPPPRWEHPGGIPRPWPGDLPGHDPGGSALACPLVADDGRCHGTLVVGRAGVPPVAGEVLRLVEDLSRRVAQALGTARRYSHQARISRVLQRGLRPPAMADVPGLTSAVVYEPAGGEGLDVGGDFYDVFPAGDGRWCFALGDVCGNGPEAATVTGLARNVVRLLAREGRGVAEVVQRLNRTMIQDGAEREAAERDDAEGPPFLSLLFGELLPSPDDTGACTVTLASAGHPLPLLLRADGEVAAVGESGLLLGIDGDARYPERSFTLTPGETLLCVTDGVTERRDDDGRQLDDGDGLRHLLASCAGLDADAVAERVRGTVHGFGTRPLKDDLAVLVLRAADPKGQPNRSGS
ncbi:hypothetical protein GCM10027168_51630 [Streptomyces capparidis]